MYINKIKYLIFCITIVLALISCEKENSECEIISFKIEGLECSITDSINIKVYKSTDISSLTPIVKLSSGATINPDCSEPIDFSNEVLFTVTAENGNKRKYCAKIDTICGINDFVLKIGTNDYYSVIKNRENKIICDVPFDEATELVNLGHVQTQINLYDNFSISEATILDLDSIVSYYVTDPNGNSETFKLIFRNTDNFIKSITCENAIRTIPFDIPFEAHPDYCIGLPTTDFLIVQIFRKYDISNVIPLANISERATVSPSFNIGQDFNQDFIYEVISETGVSRIYTVRFVQRLILVPNDNSPNNYIVIEGGMNNFNFHASTYSKVIGAQLIDLENEEQIELDIIQNDFEPEVYTYLGFQPKTPIPIGRYKIKVQLEIGEEIIPNMQFSVNS
jgi:hypothetical protein